MIKIKIKEEDKICLINIGGFVTEENAKEFIQEYKETIKEIKPSQYRLVIEPRNFKTDSEDILKNSFRMFFKTGFKDIILVDIDSLTENIKLNKLEKKFFLSRIKIVKSMDEM